jgi:hypothetical protein
MSSASPELELAPQRSYLRNNRFMSIATGVQDCLFCGRANARLAAQWEASFFST